MTDPKLAQHGGRIVKTTGDGLLIEFPSVVAAVACAVEIQDGMRAANVDVPTDRQIILRVGVNLGDVIIEEDDIFGDGVNIAARLEQIAAPGGICLSQAAFEQVRDKLPHPFQDIGEQVFKNIARPIKAYQYAPGGTAGKHQVKVRQPGLLRRHTIATALAALVGFAGVGA